MGIPTQKGVTVCFADRETASKRDSDHHPAGQLWLQHSHLMLLHAELQGLPTAALAELSHGLLRAHFCRDDQVSEPHGSA